MVPLGAGRLGRSVIPLGRSSLGGSVVPLGGSSLLGGVVLLGRFVLLGGLVLLGGCGLGRSSLLGRLVLLSGSSLLSGVVLLGRSSLLGRFVLLGSRSLLGRLVLLAGLSLGRRMLHGRRLGLSVASNIVKLVIAARVGIKVPGDRLTVKQTFAARDGKGLAAILGRTELLAGIRVGVGFLGAVVEGFRVGLVITTLAADGITWLGRVAGVAGISGVGRLGSAGPIVEEIRASARLADVVRSVGGVVC